VVGRSSEVVKRSSEVVGQSSEEVERSSEVVGRSSEEVERSSEVVGRSSEEVERSSEEVGRSLQGRGLSMVLGRGLRPQVLGGLSSQVVVRGLPACWDQ
jgi:hypothetical protein